MALPQLTHWKETSGVLHQASMLIAPIQNALLQPRTNYLQLAMNITRMGLQSLRLPQGGIIDVDYVQGAIVYHRVNSESVVLRFSDHTQQSLFKALLAELKQDELADILADADGNALGTALFERLNADENKTVFLKLEDLSGTEQLIFDADEAREYASLVYRIYTAVARFRGRLTGHMTPIVVWAEHFDLSTLWFHPNNPQMDSHQAHMNIGFAPFSNGFDKPYLYFYIYPYPDGFQLTELPAHAQWHTEGWQGVVVNYEDIASQDDPDQFAEDMCQSLYERLTLYLD